MVNTYEMCKPTGCGFKLEWFLALFFSYPIWRLSFSTAKSPLECNVVVPQFGATVIVVVVAPDMSQRAYCTFWYGCFGFRFGAKRKCCVVVMSNLPETQIHRQLKVKHDDWETWHSTEPDQWLELVSECLVVGASKSQVSLLVCFVDHRQKWSYLANCH